MKKACFPKNHFLGKDFIDTQDWSKAELVTALELASKLKKLYYQRKPTPYLLHQTLFLLFFFASTRTRTSFEAAMDRLGGNPHDLVPETLQISHGDTPKEIGKILSSYGHGIAIRHCDWKNWICDQKMMSFAKRNAVYLHCLPADRGVEVTDEVIDGPRSAVYQQAENRLHVQKAILALTMAKNLKIGKKSY